MVEPLYGMMRAELQVAHEELMEERTANLGMVTLAQKHMQDRKNRGAANLDEQQDPQGTSRRRRRESREQSPQRAHKKGKLQADHQQEEQEQQGKAQETEEKEREEKRSLEAKLGKLSQRRVVEDISGKDIAQLFKGMYPKDRLAQNLLKRPDDVKSNSSGTRFFVDDQGLIRYATAGEEKATVYVPEEARASVLFLFHGRYWATWGEAKRSRYSGRASTGLA